jgi:hypothetical protein
MKAIFLALFAAIFCLGCGHPSAPAPVPTTRAVDGPFTVFGSVTDESGRPIEGADIRANCGMGTLFPAGEARSGADGSYRVNFTPGLMLTNDNRGTVGLQAATIFVFKNGFYDKNLCRQGNMGMADRDPPKDYQYAYVGVVRPGQPRRVDFVLLPAASVSGVLTDSMGKPLANRSIFLGGPELPPSCSVLATGTTDLAGRFHFDSVPTNYSWHFGTRIPGTFIEPVTNDRGFNQPQAYHVRLTLGQDGAEQSLRVENVSGVNEMDDRR